MYRMFRMNKQDVQDIECTKKYSFESWISCYIKGSKMEKYVLSVLVENKTGVLSRVSGLFSRRGYNIDSLTVCATNNPEQSRMTIVVKGDEHILDQIQKQLA